MENTLQNDVSMGTNNICTRYGEAPVVQRENLVKIYNATKWYEEHYNKKWNKILGALSAILEMLALCAGWRSLHRTSYK